MSWRRYRDFSYFPPSRPIAAKGGREDRRAQGARTGAAQGSSPRIKELLSCPGDLPLTGLVVLCTVCGST